MKIIICLLLPLIMGCEQINMEKPQCKLAVDSTYAIDEKRDGITTFTCSDHQAALPISALKIKLIKPDQIQINCSQNSGYGGEQISFKIDRDLSIYDLKFEYASDNEGGKTETYKVEKFTATFNKNPFKEGIDNLQGKISITGKIKVERDSWFKPSFEEDLTYSSFIYCK